MKKIAIFVCIVISVLVFESSFVFAETRLSSKDLKNLNYLSRVILVSRDIEKKRLDKELISDRLVVKNMGEILETLKMELQTELVSLPEYIKNNKLVSSIVVSKIELNNKQIAAHFDKQTGGFIESSTPSKKKIMPLEPSALMLNSGESLNEARNVLDNKNRSKKINVLIEDTSLQISNHRAQLSLVAEKSNSKQIDAQGKKSQNFATKRIFGKSQKSRKELLSTTALSIENELQKLLTSNGTNKLKKVKAMIARFDLKGFSPIVKKINPTFETMTKHR